MRVITLLACLTLVSCAGQAGGAFDATPATGAVVQAQQAGSQKITGEVVGVADGDTITVLDGERRQHRIRLAGIDAPESSQDFGRASKQNLSALVYRKAVEVTYSKYDHYGRVLGVVRLDGRDINLAQVEAGLAWHYKEYQDEQTAADRKLYGEAEGEARNARRGLWADPSPIPPWDFRHGKRGRAEE
jgi:endonuclease YncB( thermonuclease family)